MALFNRPYTTYFYWAAIVATISELLDVEWYHDHDGSLKVIENGTRQKLG